MHRILLNSSASRFPNLLGARPVLSVSFHIPDSYCRAPHGANERVCSIRGGPSLHFVSLAPADSSKILLQMVSDSFAPQEVISYEIAHQRLFIRLPVLLWLLHLVEF